MKSAISKYLYFLFIVLALYQALIKKDYLDAAASLGIGLVFDPFNTEQTWKERPFWQKAILIIHLAFVAAMFGLGVGLNDQ